MIHEKCKGKFGRQGILHFSLSISHLSFLSLCCLTGIGCGEGKRATFPATGRVEFGDGKPVPGGTVELSSLAAGTNPINARGSIRPDGTFVLGTYGDADGAVAGDHSVVVLPMRLPDNAEEGKTLDPEFQIDARFQRYEETPLKVTVAKDRPNEFQLKVDHPPAASP